MPDPSGMLSRPCRIGVTREELLGRESMAPSMYACIALVKSYGYGGQTLLAARPSSCHTVASEPLCSLDLWGGRPVGVLKNTLSARCFAEVLGTYILIFFGCGAVHAAVLTGAQAGLWQVAIVWGVAIMIAVYVVGGISGAHINPAITVALATWGRFSWKEVLPYTASQLVGAFLAAATLFGLFQAFLTEKERQHAVVRGQPGSEITAMCYGEYFPSP